MADNDAGVVQTVLERLSKYRLPRALELKTRVDAGQRLADYDIEFLERVFADAYSARTLVASHPELQQLAAKLVGLYCDIASKALENEEKYYAKRGGNN
jgi:hypothetical protein